MIEIRELLRAWLSGVGLRTVAARAGVDLTFPRDRGGISYKPSVLRGRLAGVKMGLGCLVDADYSLGCDPAYKPGVGARPLKGHALLLRARRSDFRFPDRAPKATLLVVLGMNVIGGQIK